MSDGNKTSDRTDVLIFVGADGGTPLSEERELPMTLIGIGALVLAALSGFVYWARKPASG